VARKKVYNYIYAHAAVALNLFTSNSVVQFSECYGSWVSSASPVWTGYKTKLKHSRRLAEFFWRRLTNFRNSASMTAAAFFSADIRRRP